jgi:transposase
MPTNTDKLTRKQWAAHNRERFFTYRINTSYDRASYKGAVGQILGWIRKEVEELSEEEALLVYDQLAGIVTKLNEKNKDGS